MDRTSLPSDIVNLLDRDVLFEQIKQGFSAIATAEPEHRGRRHPVALPSSANGSAGMILAPGLVPGIPAYTVKINSKFPGHLPAIKGVVVLHSLEDGRIMALLDSGSVTLARTAVAGAVGTDALHAAMRRPLQSSAAAFKAAHSLYG